MQQEQTHVEGQRLLIRGEFRLFGVASDPAVVRFYSRNPAGVIVELTYPSADLTRTDLGLYEALVTADLPGTWAFRWVGSGGVEAIRELSVNVAPSKVIH